MALNLYYDANGFLPGNADGWCTYFNNSVWGFSGSSMPAPLITQYLAKVPLDPAGKDLYLYYNTGNVAGKFTLATNLESELGNAVTLCGIVFNYSISQ